MAILNPNNTVGRCVYRLKHRERFHWPLFAALIFGFCTGVLVDAIFALSPEVWEKVEELL